MEMRVESGNTGFVAELWGTIPNIVTAYLISPSGGEKSGDFHSAGKSLSAYISL